MTSHWIRMTSKATCCSVIIFLCLMQAVFVKAQCEKPNVGENRILTPESDKPDYPDGSTATFRCSTGYQPSNPLASKVITCSGNTWSKLELQCQKKRCGPLADIANGKFTYLPEGEAGILFGAVATAKCNTGYNLVGQPTRNCRDAGWDGRSPVCEAVKCLPPPEIPNGQFDQPLEEEYQYEQAVSYTCDSGYIPSESKVMVCSENGTFQPPPSQCKMVSCVEPTVVNGYRKRGKGPYGYRSIIEFECNPNYKMEGASYLVCEEDSDWIPPPPQCKAIEATTKATTKPPKSTTEAIEATTKATTRSPKPTTKEEKVPPTPPTPPPNKGLIIGLAIGIPSILDLGTILWLIPSLSVLLLS